MFSSRSLLPSRTRDSFTCEPPVPTPLDPSAESGSINHSQLVQMLSSQESRTPHTPRFSLSLPAPPSPLLVPLHLDIGGTQYSACVTFYFSLCTLRLGNLIQTRGFKLALYAIYMVATPSLGLLRTLKQTLGMSLLA